MKTKAITVIFALLIFLAQANALNTYYTFQQTKDEANWIVDDIQAANSAAEMFIESGYTFTNWKVSITNDDHPETTLTFLRNFDRGFNTQIGLIWIEENEMILVHTAEKDMTKTQENDVLDLISNLERLNVKTSFQKDCLECRSFIEPGITGNAIISQEVEECKTTEGAENLYKKEMNRQALLECVEGKDTITFRIEDYLIDGKRTFIDKNAQIESNDLCGCKEGIKKVQCCNLAMERYYHLNTIYSFCTDEKQELRDFYRDITFNAARKLENLCSNVYQAKNINLERTNVLNEFQGYEEYNQLHILINGEEPSTMHQEQSPQSEDKSFFTKIKDFFKLL